MTKTELTAIVSEKAQITKKDAEKAVSAVIDAITSAPAACARAFGRLPPAAGTDSATPIICEVSLWP